jgi:hypothetical protein
LLVFKFLKGYDSLLNFEVKGMEPVYRFPQLNKFVEDFVVDDAHLKVNAFFWLEHGRKIFPKESKQPVRLKTDFKIMLFQDIENRDGEELQDLARRVDAFNRKTPLDASPREKVNLINEIMPSTSMEQGRLAARHAIGIQTHHFPTFYPIGIYTIPEISSIGMTEEELKALGFRYEVGRAYYYEIARSHIAGSNIGMFKILFHAETLEILGIHIIGRGATEVIHIGQVAKSFNAKIDYFIDQVFNYPTYAEGYRVAALNGINKIKNRR